MSQQYLDNEKKYVIESEYIYEYLTNNDLFLNCNNKHKYEKADKIRSMKETYESELSLYDKLAKMNKIYSTDVKFSNAIQKFIKRSEVVEKYQELSDELVEILNFYRNNILDGTVEKAKEYKANSMYIDNLPFARYVIDAYIEYNDSFYTDAFLKYLNLSKSEFDFCIETIKRLDKGIYCKYLEVANTNRNLRIEETVRRCNIIKEGVTTGFYNGEEFDDLKFISYLPFYNRSTSKEILGDFNIVNPPRFHLAFTKIFDAIVPDASSEIMKKIIDYRIDEKSLSVINDKYIYDSKFIINGRELKKEDKDAIMFYIDINNLPPVDKVFTIVRDKYLNDELKVSKALDSSLVKTIKK